MRLNDMLGIQFPIIQGGMANIATGEFAAAVSNAGALGLIGAGGMTADILRQQIHVCRERTDKPFGVNIMLMHPQAPEMARIVAEECREQGRAMVAFDSLSGSLGLGMTVLQLAEDIRNGMGWEELTERRVPQLIQNTYPFFTLDTLEYLQKGGRIGKVTALAGTMLQIKPVLTFADDGQLQSIAKVRGHQQVMRKLVELTVNRCGSHKRYNLAVANGGSPEEMETVRRLLTEALPHGEHLWDGEIDGTLSVYIGDGVLGAAVQVLD